MSDEEHEDTNDGEGDGGNPGEGDGGNPGHGDRGPPGHGGGGPGGPGRPDSETESDPEEDERNKQFKKQTKSLLMLAKSIKDLVSKKEEEEYYVDETTGIRKVRKRISPLIFKGDKGERPEAHLLRAKDWFDSSGIVRNQDKVYNFKHTLDSKAREWCRTTQRQQRVVLQLKHVRLFRELQGTYQVVVCQLSAFWHGYGVLYNRGL